MRVRASSVRTKPDPTADVLRLMDRALSQEMTGDDRFAEWRQPEPGSPAQRPIDRYALRLSLTLVGVATLPFLVPNGWIDSWGNHWPALFVTGRSLFATIALLLALALAARDDTRTMPDEVESLEALHTFDGWIVDMAILQAGTITGQDRGVLWGDGGRLSFLGEYTSFSMTAKDIRLYFSPEIRVQGLTGPCTFQLADFPSVWISFTPLREPSVNGGAIQTFYRPDVRRKIAEHLLQFHLEVGGQLPPLTDGPRRPSVAQMQAWFWWSVVLNILTLAITLLSALGPVPLPVIVLTIRPLLARYRAVQARKKRDRSMQCSLRGQQTTEA